MSAWNVIVDPAPDRQPNAIIWAADHPLAYTLHLAETQLVLWSGRGVVWQTKMPSLGAFVGVVVFHCQTPEAARARYERALADPEPLIFEARLVAESRQSVKSGG